MHRNMKATRHHQMKILKSSPFVWFKDALDGYDYLVEQGYDEIVVAGLSLGGILL